MALAMDTMTSAHLNPAITNINRTLVHRARVATIHWKNGKPNGNQPNTHTKTRYTNNTYYTADLQSTDTRSAYPSSCGGHRCLHIDTRSSCSSRVGA